ncbi:MAG: terminase [Muribaculaceae bacterium]|nr:terminase [Muribaculaceae bacterium]MDE7081132.1 terminase [Muribaculaceae bacterium]
MSRYQSAADILAEDALRRRQLELPVDPVTGLNAGGSRFLLRLPDCRLSVQYLPEPMRTLPLIVRLSELGSVAAVAESGKVEPDEVIEMMVRLRLKHDFPFWAALTAVIKNKGGGADVHFRLNRAQRRLVESFEEARVAGHPIRLILLKARQWGGSTCTQLYMAWLQLMHSTGLNSLIIAHQGAGSDEIKDMFDRMIGAYPLWLLYEPDELKTLRGDASKIRKIAGVGRSGMIFRVPQRNCKVKIGSAERPDSCRGGDYNLVHLSEVGIWRATDGKSPEDIVRSACGGVLLRPLTMIVYESTANGTGNFFHREYLAAARGESQFRPLFISWYEIDQYSLPVTDSARQELATRLWEGRESDAETSRTVSGRYLYSLFERGATLEAINWYIAERAKYNDNARMAAEYPTDDVEAFAHSGCRVFDRRDVEALREACRDADAVGEVVSDAAVTGPECLEQLRFHPSPSGGLRIWSNPECGVLTDRYLAVVDVGGRSAKADWSVITVIDRAPMAEGLPPEIAAQWRGHCDADRLAWRAAQIAAFYDRALLVVESNTLETRERDRGIDEGQMPYILLQIRDAYPNLYMRGGSVENLREQSRWKLGFHTNTVTKPMVIATLVRAVRDALYVERCQDALDELLSYERRDNGSYGAIAGCHDDILMTRAIGLHIALHEMDTPRPLRPMRPTVRRHRDRPCSEASF